MSRPCIDEYVNLSDAQTKRSLMNSIGPLTGLYDVSLKPRRPTRSAQQNRYLWGVVYKTFQKFLEAQGEHLTSEEVHRLCGAKFLRRSIVNHDSGEVIGETITSTTSLSTVEFGEYLDKVIAWLGEQFGIVVPSPDIYTTEGN